jgi:hypothetical protein
MRKGTVVYDLVCELEKRVMTYREIQVFMASHPKRGLKMTVKPSRGYCCCNIVHLVNSDTIKKQKGIGYWCDPDTHKKKSAYVTKKDSIRLFYMKETTMLRPGHPEIDKIISLNPEKYV